MRTVPCSFVVLLTFIVIIIGNEGLLVQAEDTVWKGFSMGCLSEDESDDNTISCHGIRLVRKIVQKMLEDARKKKSLEIFDGVSLERSEAEGEDLEGLSRNGRVLKNFGQIGTIVSFLENRELKIKLRSLLPDNFEAAINDSLAASDQVMGRGDKGGGGGGKKGGNGIMILVIMMGKMMAAMGFGALGLLAMKAMMIASLALMLSLIVAAKKLVSKEEDSHHIVYAQESHHRRRRSLPLTPDDWKRQPYRGYLSTGRILKS